MKRLIGLALAAIIGVQSAHALERDPATGIPLIGLEFCADQRSLAREAMVMRQAGWTYDQALRSIPSGGASKAVLDLMYRSEVGNTKEKKIDFVLDAEDTVYKACLKAAKEADMKLNGV